MTSALLDPAVEHLARLVAYPTVSHDSNVEMIGYVADVLSHLGARTEISMDAGGHKANLFATVGPEGDGGIVLSGHTDVVPVADQAWTRPPFELTSDEADRLYARGSCDMKGFIAACLALAPLAAASTLARPLHFAFTYDEEVGCLGGRALTAQLQERGLRPGIALIGEPTEMRVIQGHKGCYEYKVHLTGREGHASRPEQGVNAVEYAVRYCTRLMDLAAHLRAHPPAGSPFDPPHTTLQVGRLSGGTASNIIASRAEIEWEMRPVRADDAAFVKREIAAFTEKELLPSMRSVDPAATIETEIIGEVVGLEPLEHSEAIALAQALTGESQPPGLMPFGTEAGLFQQIGTAAVVCGPGSIDQAHKPDEYLARAQLDRACQMLEKLADHLRV